MILHTGDNDAGNPPNDPKQPAHLPEQRFALQSTPDEETRDTEMAEASSDRRGTDRVIEFAEATATLRARQAHRAGIPAEAAHLQQGQICLLIGEAVVMPFLDAMLVIGRASAKDQPGDPEKLDLVPHGGYDASISRNHACLFQHDGGIYLRDLNSSNGTWVNDMRLAPGHERRLQNGDRLQFALLSVLIYFH